MTTEVSWPDKLPLPTFQGYNVQPLDSVLRTEMEAGPARQRQLYTAVPERFAVRWRFDSFEYAIFRSWYANKADRGAQWFSITLLTGLGMVPHEARFVGQGSTPYQATAQRGGFWIVTAALEVRESPDLTEEALDLFLAEDPEGLLAAMDEFNALVQAGLVETLN